MSKRIVIADHEPQVVEEATALLENIGYEVGSTTNGEHAIRLIRGQPPDLLIVDTDLTVLEGKPLHELISQDPALRAIPIVYLTTPMGLAQAREKLNVPTHNLIRKPWDVVDFISRIQGIIGEAE